jgi:hypothetical protein
MKRKTITLHTASWNNYWDKYGQEWASNVNKFNTKPDEIIIVSDSPIDFSMLNYPNVKNVIVPIVGPHKVLPYYRNEAIKVATSDWVVGSDLDDLPLENYLDDLNDLSDIHAFCFEDSEANRVYSADSNALEETLFNISERNYIPGTSAIKKYIFDTIHYEDNCYEDNIFYSTASLLNIKVAKDKVDSPRFIYSGFHPEKNNSEVLRVGDIYKKVLQNNRNVYCFWFSDDMSDNRKNCLKVLKEKSNVNIILIDFENFYLYQNEEIPIHDGFKYLSDIQKSDYARAYIMYFYGEGYSDIKANDFDWNLYFDKLFTSKHYAIGYKTANQEDIGEFWNDDENMKTICLDRYADIAGNGHYIFKPKTKFAYDWLIEIHSMMDDKYEDLKNNPGIDPRQSRDIVNPKQNDYPFRWAEIGGLVKHRIEYRHNFSTFILDMPHANIKNYR